MAPATSFLILLMLCCAGALADYYDEPTPSPPEKPGKCPLDPLENCLPTISPDECKSDDDCPGKQKCCSDLGTRECIDPIEEKPGTCPPPPRTGCPPNLPPGYCEVDTDCPGKQKCCFLDCSSLCIEV
ncbi:WAP four-disulfide core domain protein 18-like isoform X3 [Bufo bufo]|uniref:WAP four-disulfide core domain protein 18-like isoform X3 n=1 Tax=Bufo bufo TaxID=8384 RepID=UPI001ABE03A8|nr:WAP four-disulfide core domain protein 18-like isoform X3 [Bufo bufo]